MYGKEMIRKDKYGRGSAAANGEGFVDLAPGDTFSALEEQLKRRIADRFDNPVLGISASIGSKRNASELAKHLASGEEEEAHKFAAKNIGVLFAKGGMGVVHFDKKAVDETREKPEIFRVFSPFVFAGEPLVATITIKPAADGLRLYAIEALDIMRGERLEVHLAAKPRQFKTTRLLLTDRIAYYVGDVNRTHPKFIRRKEPFSVSRTAELLEEQMLPMANGQSPIANRQTPTTNHQPPTTNHQSPTFSIIIPVYNVAPYLRECLDSVLAQTFTDWEAICVDDGSTDGSGAILDEYAAKDGRFRVIHQKNAGVSVARNAALDVAQGEWISFLDSDDSLARDCLKNFYILPLKTDVNFFNTTFSYGSRLIRTCVIDSKGIVRGDDAIADFVFYLYRNEAMVNLLGFTWNKFFNAEVVRRNGVRFEVGLSCSEDEIFTLQCIVKSQSVCAFPADCYIYRCSRSGLTGKWLFNANKLIEALEKIANTSTSEGLRSFVILRICEISRFDFELRGSWRTAQKFLKAYCRILPMMDGKFAWLCRCGRIPMFVLLIVLVGLRPLKRLPLLPQTFRHDMHIHGL